MKQAHRCFATWIRGFARIMESLYYLLGLKMHGLLIFVCKFTGLLIIRTRTLDIFTCMYAWLHTCMPCSTSHLQLITWLDYMLLCTCRNSLVDCDAAAMHACKQVKSAYKCVRMCPTFVVHGKRRTFLSKTARPCNAWCTSVCELPKAASLRALSPKGDDNPPFSLSSSMKLLSLLTPPPGLELPLPCASANGDVPRLLRRKSSPSRQLPCAGTWNRTLPGEDNPPLVAETYEGLRSCDHASDLAPGDTLPFS
jgi:hypothetical protein